MYISSKFLFCLFLFFLKKLIFSDHNNNRKSLRVENLKKQEEQTLEIQKMTPLFVRFDSCGLTLLIKVKSCTLKPFSLYTD